MTVYKCLHGLADVKPHITESDCQRLGKLDVTRGAPRRLLIRLRSENTATDLLRDARRLRTSRDEYVSQKVYINPDLSPSQAKSAYDRRVKRRARLAEQRRSTSGATADVADDLTSFPSLSHSVADNRTKPAFTTAVMSDVSFSAAENVTATNTLVKGVENLSTVTDVVCDENSPASFQYE